MAYLMEVKSYCHAEGCDRQCVVEVFDGKDQTAGKFCRGHGNQMLRELTKAENQVPVKTKAKKEVVAAAG